MRSLARRSARGRSRSARSRGGFASRGARSANRFAEANLQATEFLNEAGLLANRGARSAFGFRRGARSRSDFAFGRGARSRSGFADRSARSAFDGANRFAAREFRGEVGFDGFDGANGLGDGGFQRDARTNARNGNRGAGRVARRSARGEVASRSARSDGGARGRSGGDFSRSGVLSENVRGSESEDDRKKDTSLHL